MLKTTVLLLTMLMTSWSVIAETQHLNDRTADKTNAFLGQRPYHDQLITAPTEKKESNWEAATLVVEPSNSGNVNEPHKQLRLHFIGKRAYVP